MNRGELVVEIAKKTGLSKKEGAKVIDALFQPSDGILSQCLRKGEVVSIPGFGTFSLRLRQARKGRNPQTGITIRVPRRQYVLFKPGSKLREIVAVAGVYEPTAGEPGMIEVGVYEPTAGEPGMTKVGTVMVCPIGRKRCQTQILRVKGRRLFCVTEGHEKTELVPEM